MGRCSEVDDLSMNDEMIKPLTDTGRRGSVVVSTPAWHAVFGCDPRTRHVIF